MAPDGQDGSVASYRRARIAVAAQFFTNGALFANLLPRFPEIKSDLMLSNSVYGLAIGAFSAGAFVAGLTAGALIRRFTSARVAVGGTVGIAVFLVVATLAPSAVLLGAALFAAGACDAVTDVSQNAHALRVQRGYGRSIINSVHAVWAGGAVIGGLMGAGAIALHVPRVVHLGAAAVLFSAVVLVAYRFMLPGADHDDHPAAARAAGGRAGPRVYALLAALAAIAVAGAVVEDAGSSWATLYLRDGIGAPAAIAAFGYVALVAAMFVGRLAGDRLVDRFGDAAVARAGGVLVAAGMATALAFPSVPGTVAGFAAAGLGVATWIPAAMNRADQLPGLRPGTGLTLLTWLLRIGFLASPPVVGAVADATSLRIGLLSVPIAGVVVIILAGALSARGRPVRS
ncbi:MULTISPECIES: MFS transporter [Mycobacteriaceae]|uniref:MFS transporter n=1 Tax=Mycobacteriaceae TaxID=1762 RepID=UPI0007FCF35B|nr:MULTISPECIES: MFS transporter [Mycobacteriaceae]MCK0174026.1 MFS transporter [Mycolicibacterium sp. F2034L]OBB55718.1 fucose permease [Mycobacterium sp. 852013-51886_SCH5428379]